MDFTQTIHYFKHFTWFQQCYTIGGTTQEIQLHKTLQYLLNQHSTIYLSNYELPFLSIHSTKTQTNTKNIDCTVIRSSVVLGIIRKYTKSECICLFVFGVNIVLMRLQAMEV